MYAVVTVQHQPQLPLHCWQLQLPQPCTLACAAASGSSGMFRHSNGPHGSPHTSLLIFGMLIPSHQLPEACRKGLLAIAFFTLHCHTKALQNGWQHCQQLPTYKPAATVGHLTQSVTQLHGYLAPFPW
jgi:hypothetical protein